MSEKREYNNLSPQLLAKMPKLKKGEKMTFQVNGVRNDKITGKMICPKSVRIPSTDRIYDPWGLSGLDKNGDPIHEGAFVDIAYIQREKPAPKDSSRSSVTELGKIVFTNTTAGVIDIIGGKRDREKMMMFLFFTNKNTSNKDKEWFVEPDGKQQFHLVERTVKAKASLSEEKKKDSAVAVIMKMEVEEVDKIAAGLIPNIHNQLSFEEKVMKLRTIAMKDPNKILGLSKDVETSSIAFIEDCFSAGLIEIDKSKNQILWSDDKVKLCSIKGTTPHNSLKRYFLTEMGMEDLLSLEKQLELSKKSKKEKTKKAVV